MAPDTNFKEQDPKRQYNRPENLKDRSGSYDDGQKFDPTEGYDDHPDDQFTSDMIQAEDRYLYEAGHQVAGGGGGEGPQERNRAERDSEADEAEYDPPDREGKAQKTGH